MAILINGVATTFRPAAGSITSGADAVEMLAILAAQFDVKAPKFRFNRTYRGLYYGWTREVTIPKIERCFGKRTAEIRLLHEFAHHVMRERGHLAEHHGEIYRHILWNVAEAWLGDASKYPWDTEYAHVKAYGERRLSRNSNNGR